MAQPASYLTFKLGAEHFAVPVNCVREVLDLSETTRVPGSPAHMRGVVNVRGSAVPVFDLRMKFGLPATADTVSTRIIVLEIDIEGEPVVVGGLADSVHDVLEIDPAAIVEPPRVAMKWRADIIAGLGKRGDDFLIMLDIGKVFATDETLHAAPAAA